jgi:ADP-ribose pyrophosphatase YjhB (NUDIX family)
LALPGGKLDDGETLLQCALRETIEETGMNFNDHSPFHLYGAVIPGRDGRDFYCQAFGILVEGASDQIQIPGGIEQGITAAWHTPMELLCKGAFVQYNAETLKMALLINDFKERLHG